MSGSSTSNQGIGGAWLEGPRSADPGVEAPWDGGDPGLGWPEFLRR
ncbi:MAG TPA: hypothetical protein VK550_18855 [Polyangiaceae bacterium]|nr:hypothetical protein [Polyangiaceae bacterium]